MLSILKGIPLFLLTSVKFLVGVPAAYAAWRMNFVELSLFSSISGIFGVAIFVFLSDYLFRIWDNLRMKYFPPKANKNKKKVFSRKARRYVTLVRRYGLPGVALLTPTLLSIPIGTILARRFFPNRKVVFIYLSASVILWSVALSALLHFPTLFHS
ncbi:MAG: hypothetical protein R2850_10880 [Bacteroidia bacterium]